VPRPEIFGGHIVFTKAITQVLYNMPHHPSLCTVYIQRAVDETSDL
jgi:uncharacterized protein Usg